MILYHRSNRTKFLLMSDSWQDLFSTWKGRMAFLYGKTQMTDCKFILGEGEDKLEIKLHKMVIASCSTKFFDFWFSSDVALINDNNVIISDVSSEAFKAFVFFLYNETVELNMNIVWDLLKLAKLYGVKSLINFCASFLNNTINCENAFKVLENAPSYGLALEEVENQCLYFCSRQVVFFYLFSGFSEISEEIFRKLLDSEVLPGDQLEIYDGVNDWLNNHCRIKQIENSFENKRNILRKSDDFFVKFNKMWFMDREDLEFFDKDNSFLSKNQRLKICKYNEIFNVDKKKMYTTDIMSASDKILKVENVESSSIYFARDADEPKSDSDCEDTFLVESLIMYGFHIFGKTTSSVEKVSFFLKEKLDEKFIIEDEIQVEYNGKPKKYEILFKTPITLTPGTEYHLGVINLGPCERFCGTEYDGNCFPCFSYSGPKLIRELIFEHIDTRVVLTAEDFMNMETINISIGNSWHGLDG